MQVGYSPTGKYVALSFAWDPKDMKAQAEKHMFHKFEIPGPWITNWTTKYSRVNVQRRNAIMVIDYLLDHPVCPNIVEIMAWEDSLAFVMACVITKEQKDAAKKAKDEEEKQMTAIYGSNAKLCG